MPPKTKPGHEREPVKTTPDSRRARCSRPGNPAIRSSSVPYQCGEYRCEIRGRSDVSTSAQRCLPNPTVDALPDTLVRPPCLVRGHRQRQFHQRLAAAAFLVLFELVLGASLASRRQNIKLNSMGLGRSHGCWAWSADGHR